MANTVLVDELTDNRAGWRTNSRTVDRTYGNASRPSPIVRGASDHIESVTTNPAFDPVMEFGSSFAQAYGLDRASEYVTNRAKRLASESKHADELTRFVSQSSKYGDDILKYGGKGLKYASKYGPAGIGLVVDLGPTALKRHQGKISSEKFHRELIIEGTSILVGTGTGLVVASTGVGAPVSVGAGVAAEQGTEAFMRNVVFGDGAPLPDRPTHKVTAPGPYGQSRPESLTISTRNDVSPTSSTLRQYGLTRTIDLQQSRNGTLPEDSLLNHSERESLPNVDATGLTNQYHRLSRGERAGWQARALFSGAAQKTHQPAGGGPPATPGSGGFAGAPEGPSGGGSTAGGSPEDTIPTATPGNGGFARAPGGSHGGAQPATPGTGGPAGPPVDGTQTGTGGSQGGGGGTGGSTPPATPGNGGPAPAPTAMTASTASPNRASQRQPDEPVLDSDSGGHGGGGHARAPPGPAPDPEPTQQLTQEVKDDVMESLRREIGGGGTGVL